MLAVVCLAFALEGCTMIPQYNRPEAGIEQNWPSIRTAQTTAASNKLAADTAWKDYFNSDVLKTLIDRTLANNLDLKLAALNIEAAKAAYQIQRTELLPTVTASAAGSRTGTPENASSNGSKITSTAISAKVATTSYELDFFGRIRSLNEAALESYLATENAQQSARISLIAETANAYLAYLADNKLLKLSKDTYETYKQTYDLTKRTYEIGSGTQLDVAQASTSVESAKAAISQYSRYVAQERNALRLLAGTNVEDLLDSEESIDSIQFVNNLPAGLPSEILLVRPDIQQAEHALKAANADIGAARAALYPTISLTGSVGLASDSLSNLFSSGSAYAWNFAPALTVPIFNRGGLYASLESARVNEKIAAINYQQAIQTAFREVADELAARETYRAQLDAQDSLVVSSRLAYQLSEKRYKNGIDSFLTVLDSQKNLFSAEQGAVTVKEAYLNNLITLYKVLGGGQI
jgi:multidrug efflux system outer membrane protein